MLNLEHVTSPLRIKSKTTFKSQVASEEDEEQTCLDQMGGGEKLRTTAMQGNMEEEPKSNMDQVIDDT